VSSEIILEAELMAVKHWGASQAFTYVDPTKVRSVNPGFCFLVAGWKRSGFSKSGKLLLEKAEIGVVPARPLRRIPA
jgi:hypothetical protein